MSGILLARGLLQGLGHWRQETPAWGGVAAVAGPEPLLSVLSHWKHCDRHRSSSPLLCTRVTLEVTATEPPSTMHLMPPLRWSPMPSLPPPVAPASLRAPPPPLSPPAWLSAWSLKQSCQGLPTTPGCWVGKEKDSVDLAIKLHSYTQNRPRTQRSWEGRGADSEQEER